MGTWIILNILTNFEFHFSFLTWRRTQWPCSRRILLCTVSMCFRRFRVDDAECWQCWQSNGFVWIAMCLYKISQFLKRFPQPRHNQLTASSGWDGFFFDHPGCFNSAWWSSIATMVLQEKVQLANEQCTKSGTGWVRGTTQNRRRYSLAICADWLWLIK